MPSGRKSLITFRISSANRAHVQESPDTTILTAISLAWRLFSSYVTCPLWACAWPIKTRLKNSIENPADSFLMANLGARIRISQNRFYPANLAKNFTAQVGRCQLVTREPGRGRASSGFSKQESSIVGYRPLPESVESGCYAGANQPPVSSAYPRSWRERSTRGMARRKGGVRGPGPDHPKRAQARWKALVILAPPRAPCSPSLPLSPTQGLRFRA